MFFIQSTLIHYKENTTKVLNRKKHKQTLVDARNRGDEMNFIENV